MTDWRTIAVLQGERFEFADPASSNLAQRFYQFQAGPLHATNDWKNQVAHPYDAYTHYTGANYSWIKFAILTSDPTRVYFADPNRYIFHYDFVAARLSPFIGVDADEFERVTFRNASRQLLVGTLLYPGYPRNLYGIQFVSQDPLPRELVRDAFKLVKSTVIHEPLEGPLADVFYVPAFEQTTSALAELAYFASNGIPLRPLQQWINGQTCYSQGWALGFLKFFAATNVVAAYASGQLLPEDILITDGIPAELPFVSGIISLAPTTPNSHVAILAQSYHVPFVYLTESAGSEALQWTNRQVAFQVDESCQVLVAPVGSLEPDVRSALFALRSGSSHNLTPKQRYGSYTAPVDDLRPEHIRYFGGKAANYGVLRRAIPSNSLPAIAISFDLWEDFLSQLRPGGLTLRQEIVNRLAGLTYPGEVGAIQTQLASIRSLIRGSTQFTAGQQAAITNALGGFDRSRNIRFRSSTNVEDAESFTGAGLYDSYSGCLTDDQDADNAGPSYCDASEDEERGVFRAIRRVYASFYNDNAYLERRRLGVDEEEVGMAILVHHSTPDAIEWANGVATLQYYRKEFTLSGTMVSQTGAISVANPDGTTQPEEVQFSMNHHGIPNVTVARSSSLLRLGDTVMTWKQDYTNLVMLMWSVARAYGEIMTNESRLKLDIEYKKVSPGVLELKQVREIPWSTNTYTAPFVLSNEQLTFANWHGYYDDIWMAHRLKSRWKLRHRSIPFVPAQLSQGFYEQMEIEYLDGTNVQTLVVSNFVHETFSTPWNSLGSIVDRWNMNTSSGTMELALSTSYSQEVNAQSPFGRLPETLFSGLELEVEFSQPVPVIDSPGVIGYRTNAQTRLYPLRTEREDDLFREYTFEIAGPNTQMMIFTSYWLPAEARGDDCRCPLLRFVETRIEGLTPAPIVLRGYWSQTLEAVHGSSGLRLLLEPRLELNLPPAQLQQLHAANIALIFMDGRGDVSIMGIDGSARHVGSLQAVW